MSFFPFYVFFLKKEFKKRDHCTLHARPLVGSVVYMYTVTSCWSAQHLAHVGNVAVCVVNVRCGQYISVFGGFFLFFLKIGDYRTVMIFNRIYENIKYST